MKIKLNGELVDAEAYSVAYSNDLLDGVIIDIGENYIFLSDHVESHRDMMGEIEELEHFNMADYDIDYEQAPHCWVVKSVGRMVVAEAERLLEG